MAVSLYEYTAEETEYIKALTKKTKTSIGSPIPAEAPKLFTLSRDSALNIQAIKKYGSVVTYEAGEIIFSENEVGNCMYMVLKGRVSVTTRCGGNISELGSGDLFGELSVIDGLERSATVTTIEDSMLFLISNEQFSSAIGAEPNLAIKIMNTMSSRIRTCNKKADQIERSESLRKEFKFLLSDEFLYDLDEDVVCDIERNLDNIVENSNIKQLSSAL